MDKKFIVTKNKETATLLLRAKYTLVTDANDQWVFINEPNKTQFEKLDGIRYTNILHI